MPAGHFRDVLRAVLRKPHNLYDLRRDMSVATAQTVLSNLGKQAKAFMNTASTLLI